jgi:hypothetical protein
VGPTRLRKMGIWSPARRGSALAEGVSGRPSRRGVSATGIGEVVSRRAVGEVSRVAVSGGLSGQGYRDWFPERALAGRPSLPD